LRAGRSLGEDGTARGTGILPMIHGLEAHATSKPPRSKLPLAGTITALIRVPFLTSDPSSFTGAIENADKVTDVAKIETDGVFDELKR
jgi:hypothetical protein